MYIPKNIETIQDSVYLIKGADLVITPDTSIVHIASALNKANISVYPPKGGKYGVDHLVWAPKTKETKVIFCEDKKSQYDEIDINTFDFQEMKKLIEKDMKRILFKSGSTMMGGVERVQYEYINFLVDKGFDIKVVIENDNGSENILEKEIKTKVEYLKNYEYISQIKKIRENRKRNFFSRIKYAIVLSKEKRYADKKFLEIYKKFQPDIVIDFDSSLTKAIKKLKDSKNLVWIHSSIENWKKKKIK